MKKLIYWRNNIEEKVNVSLGDFFDKTSISGCSNIETCSLESVIGSTCSSSAAPAEFGIVQATHPVVIYAKQTVLIGYVQTICMRCVIHAH